MRGSGVGEGRMEIGNRTEYLLMLRCETHDDLVVAATRHDREPDRSFRGFDLAQIEVHRLPLVCHLAERMRLIRRGKVHGEQIRGPRREGKDGDIGIAQLIGDRCDRAISAARHHEIVIASIFEQGGKRGMPIEGAQRDRVAVFGVGTDEVVDRSSPMA